MYPRYSRFRRCRIGTSLKVLWHVVGDDERQLGISEKRSLSPCLRHEPFDHAFHVARTFASGDNCAAFLVLADIADRREKRDSNGVHSWDFGQFPVCAEYCFQIYFLSSLELFGAMDILLG